MTGLHVALSVAICLLPMGMLQPFYSSALHTNPISHRPPHLICAQSKDLSIGIEFGAITVRRASGVALFGLGWAVQISSESF
jgi:hypothetical protein